MSVLESDLLALRSGDACCTVAPHAGGAIAGFWWERGRRHDWLRAANGLEAARGEANAMACFPLVPYAHRLRAGGFSFCGRSVGAAADDEAHGLHGHGWRRPWRVAERCEDRLLLEYRHDPGAWPWAYCARQSIRIAAAALTVTIEIENLSESLMPAGFGLHAFLPRAAGAMLAARTGGVWHRDAEGLPTEWTGLPAHWDLTRGRAVAELRLDHVFTGWDGRAVVEWPERRARLTIEGEQPILSFLGIRTPPAADCLCLAPASHCPDAFNLAPRGIADTGIRVLPPGARRRATVTLRPEFMPAERA